MQVVYDFLTKLHVYAKDFAWCLSIVLIPLFKPFLKNIFTERGEQFRGGKVAINTFPLNQGCQTFKGTGRINVIF